MYIFLNIHGQILQTLTLINPYMQHILSRREYIHIFSKSRKHLIVANRRKQPLVLYTSRKPEANQLPMCETVFLLIL
jgi:hypothetical protein